MHIVERKDRRDSIPLINNLEIKFFKDKEIEKGVGITDFINRIV